jgi:LysM repeat protein
MRMKFPTALLFATAMQVLYPAHRAGVKDERPPIVLDKPPEQNTERSEEVKADDPPVHLAQRGTAIIVSKEDTLKILSRRYNISLAAIMVANGYEEPRDLSAGQTLIIPDRAKPEPTAQRRSRKKRSR